MPDPNPQGQVQVASPDPFPLLTNQHDQAKAAYGKLTDARTTLDKVRVELETLTKLGDSITPEDVIKGAGNLVAHGLSPQAMASLLATMPDGSEALQQWVQGHVADVSSREAQLGPVLAGARHEMGLSALRLVAGHLGQGNGPSPSPMPVLETGGQSAS